MKKIIKVISLFNLILLSIMIPFSLSTFSYDTNDKSSIHEKYNHMDYVIDKYNIDLVVNEDNTINITENITAYFNKSKHGIILKIPEKNQISRLDGSSDRKRAKITDVSVNDDFSTSKEDGDYVIKIGFKDKTLTGEKNYVVKYKYNIGADSSKNYDELYYNLIGSGWDTVIGNISFSITMPKEFDAKKLGFSSGLYGSTYNDNIKYSVDGNKVSGYCQGELRIMEGLTVRCELPEGYFIVSKNDTVVYIVASISILFLILSFILYLRSRKNGVSNKVIETVEFYPPDGVNSLDAGFLYKGRANDKDVNSLLIYLANKGYIKVSAKSKRAKTFTITKVKDYDGDNVNEKTFFDGLFRSSDQVSYKDLYNKFYVTTEEIKGNVNSSENVYKIFEKSSVINSRWIIFMIVLSFCISLIFSIFDYSGGIFELFDFVPLVPIVGVLTSIYLYVENNKLKFFGGVIATLLSWLIFTLPFILKESIYLKEHIFGLISVVGMLIILKILPIRNSYGNEMLGKLRGFKNFLQTAEKAKLEQLVEEDPSYFYNILPYAYVLGVSDKWIKRFESISMQAPSWYDSPSVFDVIVFTHMMDRTMNVLQSQYVANSSSGSSSSGGGFSGGGFGGSSGSSW